MITTQVLAKKETTTKNECKLVKILNHGNERFMIKVGESVLWFFTSKKEVEDGSFKVYEPPYGINEGRYYLALETLMEILKIV